MELFIVLLITTLLAPTIGQNSPAVSSVGYGSGLSYNPSGSASSYLTNNKINILAFLTAANYNPFDPPKGLDTNKDTLYVLVVLNRISAFVQVSSRFTVDMDVYASWSDPLSFNVSDMLQSVSLDLRVNTSVIFETFNPRQIWFPAMIFPQFRKVEQADEAPAQYINTVEMLFPLGMQTKTPTLTLWRHIMGDVGCTIDYSSYPFDKHTCPIPILFADFDRVNIKSKFVFPKGQVMLNTFIATAGFVGSYTVNSPKFSKGDSAVRNSVLSGVSVQISLKRKTGTYAVTQFIPLILITSCGLFSLWIDPGVPPARVALCITSVLALVAFSFAITSSLPDSPYLTYTSIFNIISLFFAFSTIPAFILVHMLKVSSEKKPKPKNPKSTKSKKQEYSQVPDPSVVAPEAKTEVKLVTPLWVPVNNFLKWFISISYLIVITVYFPVATCIS